MSGSDIEIIAKIKPKNNGSFPTFEDVDGYGGFQLRDDATDRDSIPALNRKSGMIVKTISDGYFWSLGSGLQNTDWIRTFVTQTSAWTLIPGTDIDFTSLTPASYTTDDITVIVNSSPLMNGKTIYPDYVLSGASSNSNLSISSSTGLTIQPISNANIDNINGYNASGTNFFPTGLSVNLSEAYGAFDESLPLRIWVRTNSTTFHGQGDSLLFGLFDKSQYTPTTTTLNNYKGLYYSFVDGYTIDGYSIGVAIGAGGSNTQTTYTEFPYLSSSSAFSYDVFLLELVSGWGGPVKVYGGVWAGTWPDFVDMKIIATQIPAYGSSAWEDGGTDQLAVFFGSIRGGNSGDGEYSFTASFLNSKFEYYAANVSVNGGSGGGGGGAAAFVPAGTGFFHITGSIQDSNAKLVTNSDVDSAAGISGAKITPNFGSQNVSTKGTYTGKDYLYLPRLEPIDGYSLLYWNLDESSLPYLNTGTGGTLSLVSNPGNPASGITNPSGGLFDGAAGFFANGGIWTGNTSVNTSAQATTISLWIFPTGLSDFSGLNVIGKSFDSSHTKDSIAIRHGSGALTIAITLTIAGVETTYDIPSHSLTGQDWNHIGCTWDGLSLNAYINGVNVLNTVVAITGTDIDFGANGAWYLSGFTNSDAQLSNLYIDDIRIESVVRDADYFDAISNAAKHPDYATALHVGKVQLTGDLGGNATSPKVTGLMHIPIKNQTPTDGYVLTYVSANSRLEYGPSTSGSAGGDLSGIYPNPSVAKIQGFDIATTTPTDGQFLTYSSGTSKWIPQTGSTSGAAGGDLSGTYPNPIVISLSGDTSSSNDTGISFLTINASNPSVTIYHGPTYQFNILSNQIGVALWTNQLTFTLGVSGGNVSKFTISTIVTNGDGDIWSGELKFVASTGTGGTIISSDATTVLNNYVLSNGGPGITDFNMKAVVSGGTIIFQTFGPSAGGNQNVNYIITQQKVTH